MHCLSVTSSCGHQNTEPSFVVNCRLETFKRELRMLKIWGRSNSINVQKVLWCCEELKIAYERIDAGNQFGVTRTSEYLALNPNSLVPTIEDEGFHLWESNVIVRYLSHKHSIGELCPADIQQRFDCERWMDWQATVLWPALRPLFIELIRTVPENRSADVISKGERLTLQAVRILDARLNDRPFLAGNHFSMGDIPAAAAVHRWYELDVEHPALPNVQRWYGHMKERVPFRSAVMTPLS